MKSKTWFAILVAFALVLSACSNTSSSENTPTTNNPTVKTPGTTSPSATNDAPAVKDPDPVTIKFAGHSSAITEEEFNMYIRERVKVKYPHITIERVDIAEKGQSLTELTAARQIPDIYAHYPLNLNELTELELAYDIAQLAKEHKFELDRIKPEFIESIKIGSDINFLAGLPIYNQSFALFYNKDLFDRMAVDYPKDDMSWEDARDLAVKLTRTMDGIEYYGLWPDGVYRGAYQVELPWGDFVNNQPVFQSQDWKDLFELWTSLYKIPGYAPKGTNYTTAFNEGRVAMMSGSTSTLKTLATINDLNWDLVTYPFNSKAPFVGQRVDSYTLTITSQSAHKEAAFQVISVILSDEVQTMMSRDARLSVLNNMQIHQQFGQSFKEFQDKNVIAFTTPKLAILQTFKNLPAVSIINTAFNEVLYDNKDINTALREADEKMAQEIKDKLVNKP